MSRIIAAAGLLALPALVLTAAAPAEARIVCKNGYQIVNGSPIATPYCQDALVASVARQHGMKVSDAAVMNNPNTKRYVCQFVGRDIRLTTACVDANSQGRRGF
jgi:uncharacterized protein YgbK (DUF1537 family)